MSAPRPAVLLVHGLGGSAQSMAPLERALAARRVSATSITLPGHGTSPDDLAGMAWSHWKAAVDHAVCGADRGAGVVVVGQSMGGALALHTAAHGPSRDVLRAVVAVNTPLADPDAPDAIEWRMSRGQLSIDATVVDGELGYVSLPMAAVLAMASGLLEVDLAMVTVPVMVVNGALDDTVDPATGNALLAALTGVPATHRHRRVLADTGHVATFGPEVEALADLIAEMVAGLVTGPIGPIIGDVPLT